MFLLFYQLFTGNKKQPVIVPMYAAGLVSFVFVFFFIIIIMAPTKYNETHEMALSTKYNEIYLSKFS